MFWCEKKKKIETFCLGKKLIMEDKLHITDLNDSTETSVIYINKQLV